MHPIIKDIGGTTVLTGALVHSIRAAMKKRRMSPTDVDARIKARILRTELCYPSTETILAAPERLCYGHFLLAATVLEVDHYDLLHLPGRPLTYEEKHLIFLHWEY